MNVNQKGVKGLIKIIDHLTDKSWYCFPAFDDHSPVDLIIMNEAGKLMKLQIKYRSRIQRFVSERYELQASSVVNGKRVDINRILIDGWGVYLEEAQKVVFIHKNYLINKKSFIINPNINYLSLEEWPSG